MHEFALAESIVEIVSEEAHKQGFRAVRVLRLQIGALANVEPEALQFCFDAVSSGTVAEGAALDILRTPAQGWCRDCCKTVSLEERFGPCPECGRTYVEMTSGDELRLAELEVE